MDLGHATNLANGLDQIAKLRAIRRLCVGCLFTLLLVCARPAASQSLVVTDGPETLQDPLQNAARSLNADDNTPSRDLISLAKADYERLLSALYDRGYFGPTISIALAGQEASALSVLQAPENVRPVVITIDPGRIFKFGTVKIAPLPPNSEVPVDFKTGSDARLSVIRRTAQDSVDAWRTASHAKATLADQSIKARHAQSQLDVILRVEPGPALRFGALDLQNNSAVSPQRLRQIAGVPSGEAFSPAIVRRVQERLVGTGAFRSVDLREAKVPNPDGTLDLTLSVEDAPPRRIGFGAEVFSTEGLSLEAFWMHRNAFGGAERLRFDLDVDGIGGDSGGVDYSIGTTLTIPGFVRPDDTLTLSARLQSLDEPVFQSDTLRIGIRRERRFDDKRTAAIGASLRASRSTSAFGTREFQHLFLEGRAIFDDRDDKLAPREGYFGDLLMEPFLGFPGSQSGFRLTMDNRLYRSLGTRTVVAGRVKLGTVLGPTLSDTPPELLFLSGGGGSVRGQSFQSLGVVTDNGLAGGRSFLGMSAEVRQSLTGPFGVVAFADVGFVSSESDFSDLDSHAGFGLGARYTTGLGALRVDLGLPSDDPKARNIQIYIGLGEAF